MTTFGVDAFWVPVPELVPPPPWTEDPVLLANKFTNAYRASDRVSQYLIRRVIYRDDLPNDPAEVVFRILLFKVFNRIETWELLEKHVGQVTHAEYSFKRLRSGPCR